MANITVSAPSDVEELKAFLPVHRRTYLMSAEDGEAWAGWVPLENVRIAQRDGVPIGGMTLVPMGQWFGGRSVPMTGISGVGIEPAERASGGGTAFMSEVLRELYSSGVALSSLYPATNTVYRRCGYELAGDNIRYRLDTDHADVRDRSLTIENTTDHDTIKSLYTQRNRRTAGPLDRSERFWERIFEPWKREADAYLISGSDGPEGYVVYNRAPGEAVRGHMYADVVALTPAAVRRIIAFVADHRSFIETFNWNGSPADPIAFHLSEPRRKVMLSWPWMTRIVELRAALTERGYPVAVEGELHLRVSDDVLSGNDGSFILRVAGGKAELEPGGAGRVGIDIRGLAPLYTGYSSAHELLSTGYIEGSDEDLALADAMFAGPAPWLPDFF
jgi:predicted acetyltransferase